MQINDYLELVQLFGIIPNFWCSQEYLNIQDVTVETNDKVVWLQERDCALFPPLPLSGALETAEQYSPHALKIWSDFANYSVGNVLKFLDWEYTYDSGNFKDMKGKKWATFRKNTRKWPRRNPEWEYTFSGHACPEPSEKEITALLIKWLEKRPKDEIIHGSETLEWFLFKGSRRAFLTSKGRLLGVNVWDSFGDYLMYRYCITDPEEPFLNEFIRLLFYNGFSQKLVIDGGSLGDAGLERFKDKLNPVRKRKVYSRIIK